MNIPRLVIGGTQSGSGKTTVATGLTIALKERGFKVQPFKCGPDYIDPGYLTLAAGRPCHNLDSWMLPAEAMVELFLHSTKNSDFAVIEGVMGLYDGRSGEGSSGSTAEIARRLGSPVILLLDVAKMSASAAAIVLGFRRLDPALNIIGVILNQVGSPSHLRSVTEPVEKSAGVPVLGYLPKEAKISLPERHLGLVPTAETAELAKFLGFLREQIESTIDVSRIIELAKEARPVPPPEQLILFPEKRVPNRASIAVARDEAFNFYYQHNLDLLSARGARIKYFSPLRDSCLPPGTQGVYIGGGFPEMYAAQLSENSLMKKDLNRAAADGIPIYAECGGLMYLSQGIADCEGNKHKMVGLVPGWAEMQGRRTRIGYAEAEVLRDGILARRGQRLRGHLFHWSKLPLPDDKAAYRILGLKEQPEGFIGGPKAHILASFLHLHFGSEPKLAERFVDSCARRR